MEFPLWVAWGPASIEAGAEKKGLEMLFLGVDMSDTSFFLRNVVTDNYQHQKIQLYKYTRNILL